MVIALIYVHLIIGAQKLRTIRVVSKSGNSFRTNLSFLKSELDILSDCPNFLTGPRPNRLNYHGRFVLNDIYSFINMLSVTSVLKKQVSPKISYLGKRLIIEWDNREISRSCFLTIFMLGFWFVWTPVTLFLTYLLFTGEGPAIFLSIWLIFGYLGVIGIPVTWMLRWTVERIELDDKKYRHYHVGMPRWFSREWATFDLTQIDFGHYDEESITTLNVRRGGKRDMIAYWAHDEFRQELFDTIRSHVDELGIKTPVVDLRESP